MTPESRTNHCATINNWKEKSTHNGNLFLLLNSNTKRLNYFGSTQSKPSSGAITSILFELNYKHEVLPSKRGCFKTTFLIKVRASFIRGLGSVISQVLGKLPGVCTADPCPGHLSSLAGDIVTAALSLPRPCHTHAYPPMRLQKK